MISFAPIHIFYSSSDVMTTDYDAKNVAEPHKKVPASITQEILRAVASTNMDPLKSLSMTVEWYRSNAGKKFA